MLKPIEAPELAVRRTLYLDELRKPTGNMTVRKHFRSVPTTIGEALAAKHGNCGFHLCEYTDLALSAVAIQGFLIVVDGDLRLSHFLRELAYQMPPSST